MTASLPRMAVFCLPFAVTPPGIIMQSINITQNGIIAIYESRSAQKKAANRKLHRKICQPFNLMFAYFAISFIGRYATIPIDIDEKALRSGTYRNLYSIPKACTSCVLNKFAR